MPLISHTPLPSLDRLREEGTTVLNPDRAQGQYIRELHIGLLNMMPDAALEATERQFLRLIGESNPIAQFYVHPFTLPSLERGKVASQHIASFYESFDQIRENGLDALIVTGANVVGPELKTQSFWEPLKEVIDWAYENVTSTLCSCLATHAVLEFRYQQKRRLQEKKAWGVFSHGVMNQHHPLVADINTRFDVPHSRWNLVARDQFDEANLLVLAESEEAGVHLATSPDGLRFVMFQGHPEYDTVSLLKEYKREVSLFAKGERKAYPEFPGRYLPKQGTALLAEYKQKLIIARASQQKSPDFPESLVTQRIENTWHDTAEAVVSNWLGCVYQVTHKERKIPFMENVDPKDPLGLRV
ncbi:MAG: homoserine O-succinyltransferase [Gammaproteobacteria bacterium]